MAESLEVVLGRRLAVARTQAGLSQVALHKASGIGVAMVSMVERGQRLPTTQLQLRWAAACGTTLAEVYTGLEDELAKRRGR